MLTFRQLVQKGRSNIVDGHLKGALTVMVSNSEAANPTAMFLERVRLQAPSPTMPLAPFLDLRDGVTHQQDHRRFAFTT